MKKALDNSKVLVYIKTKLVLFLKYTRLITNLTLPYYFLEDRLQ